MPSRPDVLIVGGGPAGAAAACHLARAGRRVLLIERDTTPRPRVCGEFLSANAALELAELGLPPSRLGAAPIERIRLASGASSAEGALPFAAFGLARELLDEQLLASAAQRGAEIRRGARVCSLRREGYWRITLADRSRLEAPVVLLATGKHDLRGHPRLRARGHPVIGFKMHWRLARSQARLVERHVELVWFEGGYAGLQLIDQGRATMSLVIGAGAYARLGRSWADLLAHLGRCAPHLGTRLQNAQPMAQRPAAVADIPYGFIHTPQPEAPGLYRVGDQFAVIPSFVGEGIALALRSARLAAAAVLAEVAADDYHRATCREISAPMGRASWLAGLGTHPVTRRAIVAACRISPGLLPTAARATWLPHSGP
jgi:menaquinone-9 beta-reductase